LTRQKCERVVLVGFMGAGKSTVGREVASKLGWRFLDLDREIESEAGATIAEIFDRFGEPHFRRLESEVGKRILSESRVVVATGGGWPVQPGTMEALASGTVAVWLRVSLAEALKRTARDGQARPLLAGVHAREGSRKSVEKRFDQRASRYSLAGWAVDTEGCTVEDVTAHVLGIVAEYESEEDTE